MPVLRKVRASSMTCGLCYKVLARFVEGRQDIVVL